MLVTIPAVLTADQVAKARSLLADAEWVDGKVTAGAQSALAKRNQQLPQGSAAGREIASWILSSLGRHALFVSAALPKTIYPPLFNRYGAAEGHSFGNHVDNAIRFLPDGSRLRTDLSATLFLSEPDDYDGGALTIEDTYGLHQVKLPAGDMILYPASSLHLVRPVTRGVRTASFFWIQSMVRDDGERTLLYDLDRATQQVHRDLPDSPAALQLTGIYHNLLRRWADA